MRSSAPSPSTSENAGAPFPELSTAATGLMKPPRGPKSGTDVGPTFSYSTSEPSLAPTTCVDTPGSSRSFYDVACRGRRFRTKALLTSARLATRSRSPSASQYRGSAMRTRPAARRRRASSPVRARRAARRRSRRSQSSSSFRSASDGQVQIACGGRVLSRTPPAGTDAVRACRRRRDLTT